ncbi:MAG: 4-hydroxy-tetrahydrodipicolinate synthase [Pseudomonadota bacterium]
MFRGSFPALITPFKDGRVDEDAFARFVEWQIAQGSHGLVPVGTTGESPTLSHEEHQRVVALCIEIAAKRVPVIAGAGANATAEAVSLAKHAEAAGADGILSIVPYYNKPTQEGIYQHMKAVNDAVSTPIIMYNVPGRTIADMQPETMARCAALKNIVGVKDATANLARASAQRANCGADFVMLSGEDATALGFNAHGGTGCISVTANVAPKLCAELQNACLAGDFPTALKIQDRLFPLHDALFAETSPAPVKYAVSKLGFCAPAARLPMVPISDATRKLVDDAMAHAGLLQPEAAE